MTSNRSNLNSNSNSNLDSNSDSDLTTNSSSRAERASHPLKVIVPAREGQVSMAFARGGVRQGAGRKPIGETRKVSITLAPELWLQLEQQCELQGFSRSEWLRRMIEDALAAAVPNGTAAAALSAETVPAPQQQRQSALAADKQAVQQQGEQ